MSDRSSGFRRLGYAVLLLPVANGRTDRIFREHRAVNLNGRQSQLFHNVGVLDLHRFCDRLALNPLGGERGRGDGGTTAEGLELCFFDYLGLRIDADLQTHDVAALRGADQTRAYFRLALIHLAHVPRIVVVINYLVAICHFYLPDFVSSVCVSTPKVNTSSAPATQSLKYRCLLSPFHRAAK